jgi:polyhydroxybutyrate depolymerase
VNSTLGVGLNELLYTHNGVERSYLLYVPINYDQMGDLPLLYNFHGFGGSANDHLSDSDFRDIADEEGFFLVYPQGTLLNGFPHWNAALSGGDNKSNADDFGFIEALTQEIANDWPIDLERIYATGYSNGAMLSYGLACYSNRLVAAVASVSGTMLDQSFTCQPSQATSVLHIHGTDDSVLPYEGNSEVYSATSIIDFWKNHNQTDTIPEQQIYNENGTNAEYIIFRNGSNNTAVAHYKMLDGGHVWFNDIIEGRNMNQIIWDFLASYDLNGLRE